MPLFALPNFRALGAPCIARRDAVPPHMPHPTLDCRASLRRRRLISLQAVPDSLRQQPPLPPGVSPEEEEEDVGPSAKELLQQAANFIATSHQLIPYDEREVQLFAVIWRAIREIPEERRWQLVRMLGTPSIQRLWRVAGQRYSAPASLVASAIGQEYSVFTDLPAVPEEIVQFTGRAALRTHLLGLSNFSAAAFLHPDTEDPYGRVLLGKGPILDQLYPLYFSCSVGRSMVPGTQELCDVELAFPPPDLLGLTRDDIPRSRWPSPRRPLPPFDEGFTAYLRAAGPGVYVGRAVRTAAAEPVPPRFFVVAKQQVEKLL